MKGVLSLFGSHMRPALVLMAVFSLALGVLYPAVVGAVVKYGFNLQIEEGVIRAPSGRVLATSFSGPAESRPQYFWGQIYSADTAGCPAPGATGAACQRAVTARVAALHAADPDASGTIPSDLVTIASSNLQPDISLAAAQYQSHRVALARHIPEQQVDALIRASTRNSTYNTTQGLYVNVLELNLRLDGALA